MSKLQTVKIKDIKPNPYRDLVGNPLVPEKVAALVQSINNTDFWTNVTARPSDGGTVEIAYGHTRVAAAREAGLKEVELVIQDRTDQEMMLMMHDENSEDYAYNVLSVIEIVRAVVLAYAKGTIKLNAPGDKARNDTLRYAPSFAVGTSAGDYPAHPYTVDSIASFLGMTESDGKKGEKATRSVAAALNALFLMEVTKDAKKPITEQTFAGLNSTTFYEKVRTLVDLYKRDLKLAENRLRKEEEMSRRFADQREQAEKEKLAAQERLKEEEDAADRARAKKVVEAAAQKEKEAKEREDGQAVQKARALAEVNKAKNDLTKAAPQAQAKAAPSVEYKPSTKKSNSEAASKVAKRVTTAIAKILTEEDSNTFQLKEVIRSKANLPDAPKEALVKALKKAADRLTDAANKLEK